MLSPTSARMGGRVYGFARREIAGAFDCAWMLEYERLCRKSVSVWSLQNEVFQSYIITVVLQRGPIAAFGWSMLPFLLIHNVFAWWVFTRANYIEHYGLLRDKQPDGKCEQCYSGALWPDV
jgi:alkane 1-monooxygenase